MPLSNASPGLLPGTVAWFAASSAPAGFVKANGAALSRTAYAGLFAAIGTTYGAGDGSTTFNVPDLRGEFIRGLDDGRGVDTGRGIGTAQTSQNLSHAHAGSSTASAGAHTHNVSSGTTVLSNPDSQQGAGSGGAVQSSSAGAHTHTLTIASDGGTEARPRNVALLACIKF